MVADPLRLLCLLWLSRVFGTRSCFLKSLLCYLATKAFKSCRTLLVYFLISYLPHLAPGLEGVVRKRRVVILLYVHLISCRLSFCICNRHSSSEAGLIIFLVRES